MMNKVGLHRLEPRIDKPREPIDFAPPAIRNGVAGDEPAIHQITSFGELPTKEIDEIISAAEAEVEELKRTAQMVRNMYTKCTNRIAADVRRLREGVRLSMQTMETLREQCTKLNVDDVVETERELRDLAKSDDQPAQ
jgi:hypothetical protein